MAVGQNIGIEAALPHGRPPCVLYLRSVGVAPRSASFMHYVYDVPNEAFQPTHILFSTKIVWKDFTSEADILGKLVQVLSCN